MAMAAAAPRPTDAAAIKRLLRVKRGGGVLEQTYLAGGRRTAATTL